MAPCIFSPCCFERYLSRFPCIELHCHTIIYGFSLFYIFVERRRVRADAMAVSGDPCTNARVAIHYSVREFISNILLYF